MIFLPQHKLCIIRTPLLFLLNKFDRQTQISKNNNNTISRIEFDGRSFYFEQKCQHSGLGFSVSLNEMAIVELHAEFLVERLHQIQIALILSVALDDFLFEFGYAFILDFLKDLHAQL